MAHLHTPSLRGCPATRWRRSSIAHAALLALASGLSAGPVIAQPSATTQPSASASLPAVTVSDQTAAQPADVTGFGDVPLRELPLSATVVGSDQLKAIGARRLADLTVLDASVTDAYNSPGYWDFLTVRGFVLDNRFNYRREGLPISAETSIPLDNKERLEILKGTSGIQAGTSAPGGLVNYVVKRPTEQPLREVRLEVSSRASVLAAADLGGRFGVDNAFGYRLNVAAENLKPLVRNLDGQRSLLSLATDWRLSRDTLIEGEFEWSKKTQPSQQAFSLLGSTLPAVPDPRLNLNNQPWSQPSVFDALTGSLRLQQALGSGWSWTAQLGRQYLRSDDRLAYAFGCSAEGNYDRFCSDGTYDMYDFRSENERRTLTAASATVKGQVNTGSVRHDLSFGALVSRLHNAFQMQAYNYVGSGNVSGTVVNPADASLTDQNTNRTERSTELFVNDAIRWNDRLTTWLGLRATQLDRASIRTDGSRPTSYGDTLATPWVALSYKLSPATLAYASWGQGVESQIVPNKPSQYNNPGQALPAIKSTQYELGLKGEQGALSWQTAWFHIKRPVTNLEYCANSGATCTGAYDGEAVHQGLEGNVQWRVGALRLGGSLTLMDAVRQGSLENPAVNGKKPTNVPDWTLRAQAAWRLAQVPGLELQSQLIHEAQRAVTPTNDVTLPAWTRLDVGAKYERKVGGTLTTWSLSIENLTDRRYWKESPYQYGHVYLFAGAPRTLRLAFTASL